MAGKRMAYMATLVCGIVLGVARAGDPGDLALQTNDAAGQLTRAVVNSNGLDQATTYADDDEGYLTGITDPADDVVECYYHSSLCGEFGVVWEIYLCAYGASSFVDAGDVAPLTTNGIGPGMTTGDCRVFGFDCAGDLDSEDQQTLEELCGSLLTDTQETTGWVLFTSKEGINVYECTPDGPAPIVEPYGFADPFWPNGGRIWPRRRGGPDIAPRQRLPGFDRWSLEDVKAGRAPLF